MKSRLSQHQVEAFAETTAYRKFVAELKKQASEKKHSLSPNDVPQVVLPPEPGMRRRVFARGFVK